MLQGTMLVVMPQQTATFPFFYQQNGAGFDLESLSFQVFDMTSGVAVQAAPLVDGDRAPVDVDSAPGRLDIGRYAGTWVVPSDAGEGAYFVRWFWQVVAGGDTFQADVPFDVVTVGPIPTGPIYMLPSEAREEGVLASGTGSIATPRLLKAIVRAGQYIEKVTRRFFEARALTLHVDGKHSPTLFLDLPIVGVTSLLWSETRLILAEIPVESESYRIYNRHLRGLTQPDDRALPRIELYGTDYYLRRFVETGTVFPRGKQNIQITGVFGYTDPDGTPFGKTPDAIREATLRLALRFAVRIGDRAAQLDADLTGRLLSESTRDQSASYAARNTLSGSAGVGVGAFTGDPAIDSILLQFLAPPTVAVA